LDSNRLQVKDVLLSIYVTLPQPLSPQFLTGNFGFGSPHELLRLIEALLLTQLFVLVDS